MGAMKQTSSPGARRRWTLLTLTLGALPGLLAAQETAAPARKPDVHFVPSNVEVVRAMLGTAKVSERDTVYDLGCGDGRFVITAVKRYKAPRGVCVDIDPQRIKESRQNADTAGVASKIEFLNADLFETDLSPATVVTLYLLPMLNVRLRPKLFRELDPGTRIVSNAFDMGDWKPDSTMNVKNEGGFTSYAYYWRIPADASGTWKVTGSPAGDYTMRLEQRYQEVNGTAEVGGKSIALVDERLTGDTLTFTLRQGGTPLQFSGTVNGERISGTVGGKAWSASRTQRGQRPELADSASTGTH
jgi:SAM-dependent methyltransferase